MYERKEKSEKPIIINGYTIKYNNYWGRYHVSHPKIGSNIAGFKFKKDAISYAKRG